MIQFDWYFANGLKPPLIRCHISKKKQPKRLFSCWCPLRIRSHGNSPLIQTHHVGNMLLELFPFAQCRLIQACSMMSIILCMFFLGRALSFLCHDWMDAYIWGGSVYSRSFFPGFMIHFHLTSIWENMFGTFPSILSKYKIRLNHDVDNFFYK